MSESSSQSGVPTPALAAGAHRDRQHERLLAIVLFLAAACLAVAAHWSVLSARATFFDDDEYLIFNPLVSQPSLDSARQFLVEVRSPSTVRGYYQPLSMISLMLDAAMGGRPDHLMPFHRTSLILHAANAFLLALLVYQLFDSAWAAALAAILFGVHPMAVETIAWVGERKTVFATVFALCCLNAHVRYARVGQWRWYALSLLACLLALMSKPTTTPLPLLLLLLDFWPLKRLGAHPKTRVGPASSRSDFRVFGWALNWRAVAEKIPFLALAGLFAWITIVSQGRIVEMKARPEYPAVRLPLLVAHNLAMYVSHIFWPVRLSSLYPFPASLSLREPMVAVGLVSCIAMAVMVIATLRRTRAVLVGALFFLIAIGPTLMNIGYSLTPVADKYAYFPAVGVVLVLAWGLRQLWSMRTGEKHARLQRAVIAGCVLLIAVGLSAATRRYLAVWRDTPSLHHHLLSVVPESASVHNNLGVYYNRTGQFDLARKHLDAAVGIKPDYAEAHANLGAVLVRLDMPGDAVVHYERALARNPNLPVAHYNLGNLLAQSGRRDEAVNHYREVLRINPHHPEALTNLGKVLLDLGRDDEAIECLATAIGVRPDLAPARNNYGIALARRDRLAEAIEQYREALRLQSDLLDARFNLANALARLGKTDEAIDEYRHILRIDPDHLPARARLRDLQVSRHVGE